MKKITTLLITFLLLAVFAACGEGAPTNKDDDTAANNKETVSTSQSDTTQNDSEVQTENSVQNDSSKEDAQSQNQLTFTEVVAVENEECAIEITGIEPDILWGYALKAQLENKSSEKTYMFSVENAAINGVQCDPFFASEVAAGKKANEEISFSNDVLAENGIDEYTDIELTFRVYDSNDWTADAVARETVHIYPYGEDKAAKFVRESQPSDNVIIDNDFVTVIVTGYKDDEIWGYTANLFLINKTDKNVMFSASDVSVNGFMADPFFATSVSAGKCAFSSMSWSDSTLEENGISEVETIEFTFRAYDEDNWLGDDFANELITLNP